MPKGSQGLAKSLERPLSEQGAARRDGGKSYSQTLHSASPSKDAPRSLPFSSDAEKGVLCSMLLSPRDVSDLCVLRLQPPAFYAPAHQIIYELVLEFTDKSKPIDFITLKQTLQDRAQLEEVGGIEFLNELYGFVPTAANLWTPVCIHVSVRLPRDTRSTHAAGTPNASGDGSLP